MLKYIAVIVFIVFGCKDKINKKEFILNTADTVIREIINDSAISKKGIEERSKDFYLGVVNDIIDTLAYYKTSPSFYIEYFDITYKLKGFKVDNEKFAVGIILGQQLIVFKLKDNSWKEVYREEVGMNPYNIKIKIIDINFDEYDDVLISDVQGVYGNSFTTTLLYRLEEKELKRNTSFDLVNIELDNKNKLLRSQSFTSACGYPHKYIYKPKGNKIVLEGKAYIIPQCQNNSGDTLLTLVKKLYHNDKLKDSTSIKNVDSWRLFLKTFWDNSKDYDFE